MRDITGSDWPLIMRIQEHCYPPGANETVEALESHWRIAPRLCKVAECDGSVVGYVMAHPWPLGMTPPLNTVYDRVPANSDSLFIHDLAVLPAARGVGAGNALARAAIDAGCVMRMRSAALIAVQGSEPFWARFGFVVAAVPSQEYTAAVRRLYPGGQFSYMQKDHL